MAARESEQRDARADRDDVLPLGLAGRILLHNWWLVLIGVIAGVAGGLALTRAVPPTYSATATQLVKGIPGAGVAANYEAAQFAVSRARSYPSFIYSQEVLQGVGRDMGVDDLTEVRKSLSATNPTDTPLVQIVATGRTGSEARDKANSAARHMATFITDIETVSGKTPIAVETAVQALLPQEPSDPRPSVYAAVGASIGLVLTVILAVIRHFLSRREGPMRAFGRHSRRRAPRRPPAYAVGESAADSLADPSGSAENEPAPVGQVDSEEEVMAEVAGSRRRSLPRPVNRRGSRRRSQLASHRVRPHL